MTNFLPDIPDNDLMELIPRAKNGHGRSQEIRRIAFRSDAQQFALDEEARKVVRAQRNTTAVSGASVNMQETLINHAEDAVERQTRESSREKMAMVADQVFKQNNRAHQRLFSAYEKQVVAILTDPVTPPKDERSRLARIADELTNMLTDGIPER